MAAGKPTISLVLPKGIKPSRAVVQKANRFLNDFKPFEQSAGINPILLHDKKSGGYYVVCHLESSLLASKSDTDAVLDPTDSEEYKLNRNIYTDNFAYRRMQKDALDGRSFEDIVIEYDTSYRPNTPLKVFGGQHRINAIKESVRKHVSTVHGVRVYFDLDANQKLEIATVNNTSIAVANDLLDRMQEDSLGPDLRDWCQSVGLLDDQQNFADKRSPEGVPTVRIARSLILNFYEGSSAKLKDIHTPTVCKSGPGVDEKYLKVREHINWADPELKKMGQQFARLHKLQRDRVLGRSEESHIEFANKATHPSVAASWAYAAGLLRKNNADGLAAHYALADSVGKKVEDDPLNAAALLAARLKGVDPDTYRGLGSRISAHELGRMLEVFILQATKARKRGINLKLANAAIQSYEAKKAHMAADKAIMKI